MNTSRRDFCAIPYQESLQLKEQLGDKIGASATKRWLAVIANERGNPDAALTLYGETLITARELGDVDGQASSLSQMASIYIDKNDLDKAQEFIEEALEIGFRVKNLKGIAMGNIKLGQVAQLRGDKESALARYREGLAIFERMGMPEANQVRQMIASLEGGAESKDDPLAQFIARARNSAERKDMQSAIQSQEQAVELARGAGQGREGLVTLSVILYNLAGYYGNVDRYEDAAKAMEEVVSIDEQTGHQDLESDRKMLETFRRIASLSPEERAALKQKAQEEQNPPKEEDGFEAQLQAQLAELPPERRAEVEAQLRKAFEEFQRMTPEEKAAKLRTAQAAEEAQRRKRVDQYANQARDAGLAYFRKQAPKRDVLNMLEESAAQMKANEKPGSAWLEVAALCLAIVALIKEEAIPPVPTAYASHFSAVQSEWQRMRDE